MNKRKEENDPLFLENGASKNTTSSFGHHFLIIGSEKALPIIKEGCGQNVLFFFDPALCMEGAVKETSKEAHSINKS